MSGRKRTNRATLVYLRSAGIFLKKKAYRGWAEMQTDFPNYMTSLGPWSAAQIVKYFEEDLGDDDSRWPLRRGAIERFFASGTTILKGTEA